MMERIREAPCLKAGLAGAFYAIIIVAAPFAEVFVRGRLVEYSAAAATAANILAHETLYRLADATDLITFACDAAVALLFGMEHNYIIAGVMAGVAYNLLAVYSRSIAHCVLSHGVTNLILGIYVLTTGKWQFW